MDLKLGISTIVFLLLTFINTGDSIQCYQCDSHKEPSCADPFFDEGEDWRPKDPRFLQYCPEDTAERTYFCRKTTQTVYGEYKVIRSCGWIQDERLRDCYTTVFEAYNTIVCACQEEGCNGATGFTASLFATLSAVLLAYLMH